LAIIKIVLLFCWFSYTILYKMRVKKDKAYVVVSAEKERVQGAFPYTPEGKKQAQAYLNKISKKEKNREFKVKVV